MLLRRLVTNWVRQTAQERIQEVASNAARESLAPPSSGDAEPAEASAKPELPPCQVAFVFAAAVEAGGLVDRLRHRTSERRPTFVEHTGWLDDRPVLLVESGVGPQAAEQATRDVIAEYDPAWIVSAGFACALCSSLRRGHVLMADEVIDPQGERAPIVLNVDRAGVEKTPSLHMGRLLSVDHLVRTAEERRTLGQQHDALACDMESMGVARACRKRKQWLSVRIVSEALDDQLPVELERLQDQNSWAAKLGVAAGALFHRPSSIKDMWKLKEDALKASDRLARFLEGVTRQLSSDTAGD